MVCILAGAMIGLVRVLSMRASAHGSLPVEQVNRSRAGERRCMRRLADLLEPSREEIFWHSPASSRGVANHEG